MKLKLVSALLFLAVCSPLFAEDQRSRLTLKLPDDFFAQTCPSPVWKNVKIVLRSVADARDTPEIGRQSAGKNAVFIEPDPYLNMQMETALKRLFETCGLKVVSEKEAPALIVSVGIQEFYVNVQKKFVKGTGEARSQLSFNVRHTDRNFEEGVEVGYEMDAKSYRRPGTRRHPLEP